MIITFRVKEIVYRILRQGYAKTRQARTGLRGNQRLLRCSCQWMPVHTLIVSIPYCLSDNFRSPLSPTTAEELTVLAMEIQLIDSRHLLNTEEKVELEPAVRNNLGAACLSSRLKFEFFFFLPTCGKGCDPGSTGDAVK